MFPSIVSTLLALTAATLLVHAIGMLAAGRRFTGPRLREGARISPLPPITLLKPLKGLEDGLEDNLRSFYEQDYPAPIQIVFATETRDDDALPAARRLAEEHPHVETVFARAVPGFGLNPKVCNMQGGLAHARHDLVLQSDANVRVAPGYLHAIVSEMLSTDASLLGSLVVGVGERTLGAAVENLQLTTFTSPGLLVADQLAGIRCVLGKAMLFRRSELDALGGLAMVKDVLAEDYVLGQTYERAGLRVVVSNETVANINQTTTLARFLARHDRWLKMRAVCSAPGFAADLASNPTPFALLAWLASGFDLQLTLLLACVVGYKALWDRWLLLRLRGHGMGLRQLWATPLRDLALAGLWCHALFARSVEWRGVRLQLTSGSTLHSTHPPPAPDPRRALP